MKSFLFLFFSFVSISTFANCKVYIPKKHFTVNGDSLYLDFTEMLSKHNYVETKNEAEASFRVEMRGRDKIGLPFVYAEATLYWSHANGQPITTLITTKQCYSGACTVQNYLNSFRRAYAALSSNMSSCFDLESIY